MQIIFQIYLFQILLIFADQMIASRMWLVCYIPVSLSLIIHAAVCLPVEVLFCLPDYFAVNLWFSIHFKQASRLRPFRCSIKLPTEKGIKLRVLWNHGLNFAGHVVRLLFALMQSDVSVISP